MLENAELRELLSAEGKERLAKMEEALLRLEANARDAEAMDDLFRHAHSLKGAARLAELDELATRAHALEDQLAQLRGGKAVAEVDASLVLRTIDEMRALLAAATGERSPRPAGAAPSEAPAPAVSAGDDGLRVATSDLDEIFNASGELAIVRHRLERRRDDALRLLDAWKAEGARAGEKMLGTEIQRLLAALDNDHASLVATSALLDETIQRVRLIALDAAIGPLRRVVRDVSAESGKRATFDVDGGDTRLDKRVLDGVRDALMHLVRNAVDHGLEPPAERVAKGKRETGVVRVRAYPDGSDVVLEIEDDGRGFDVEAVRATAIRKGLATADELRAASAERILDHAFLPGFTTKANVTDISGRGVGLDVVRDAARRLGGSYQLVNRPGAGALIRMRFPASRSAARVLVVRLGGRAYALPVEVIARIERAASLSPLELEALRAVPLARLLRLPPPTGDAGVLLDLVIGAERAGVLVDAVEGEQEIIVKPHTRLLRNVRHVVGAAILEAGDVCIVLDANEVVSDVLRRDERPRVLVVDDSPATRARIADILRRAGYESALAQDGVEALALLASGGFAAVVSDVDMPRMDGLALVRRLRQDAQGARLPIVLVSGRSTPEDRARGAEAGADAYVGKGASAGKELVAELRRLLAA